MAAKTYVRCRVLLGFFDSEYLVVIDASSAFVDRSNVKVTSLPQRDREVDGKVLAYLVDEKRGQALIELPGQPVVGSLRSWVPKSQLASA